MRKGTGQLQLAAVLMVEMVDGGVPGWGECRVKLGRSPPQLSSSSRLRSSDQIRTIIYNFAGDTGHQQEATSTIMEQTARAGAGEHFTWWTLRQVKMATNDLLYTFRFGQMIGW